MIKVSFSFHLFYFIIYMCAYIALNIAFDIYKYLKNVNLEQKSEPTLDGKSTKTFIHQSSSFCLEDIGLLILN